MNLLKCLLGSLVLFFITSTCNGMPAVTYQVDKNYPPYTFQTRDYLYGFDFSLITLVLDHNDYVVNYSADSWEKVYARLVKGEVDIGGIIAVTEERKKQVLFTKPLFNSYVSLYTLANAPTVGLDDLPRLKVGVGKGYYTETLLSNDLGIKHYQAYEQMEEALQDLQSGKLDVIFENQQLMDYIIIEQKLKGAVVPQVTNLFPREHAYAVSPKRPELVAYMNNKLDKLKITGVFEELYVKFFYTHSDYYQEAQQQKLVEMIIIAVLTLAMIGVIIRYYVKYLKNRLQANYWQLMEAHEELQATEEELIAQNEELQAKEAELLVQNEELRTKEEELAYNYYRIRYTALHDNLTGLPNRAHLHEWLETKMKKARQGEGTGAVLFIDLDDLKTVNDSLGHRYGDALIIKSGALIVNEVGKTGFVSRIGGDEFIAVLSVAATKQEIADIAERIIGKLAYEHAVADIRLQSSASIGVALYPEHGDTVDEILKNADNAMYAAKKRGKNCWRFYEPSMQAETYEHMALTAALRTALERGELSVVYQPQVRSSDQIVSCFEALLRWNSPQHGMVPPQQFIPLAEQTGMIHSIGSWVLQEACLFAKHLNQLGWEHIRVGVNVSPIQLCAEDFVHTVKAVIDKVGIEPARLELEITETALMTSLDNVIKNLAALHESGIRLALDDFGTGYSSLTYLHRLPVNTLKIDKSFIDMILTNSVHTSIIANIVDMAHGMSMDVVAEGVETKEQVEFLAKNRCDFFQGYYFGRPSAATDALTLLYH